MVISIDLIQFICHDQSIYHLLIEFGHPAGIDSDGASRSESINFNSSVYPFIEIKLNLALERSKFLVRGLKTLNGKAFILLQLFWNDTRIYRLEL